MAANLTITITFDDATLTTVQSHTMGTKIAEFVRTFLESQKNAGIVTGAILLDYSAADTITITAA